MAEKAYKNLEFLASPAARHIRILCEYEEPRQRFLKSGVHHTIVFFGSARIRASETANAALEGARSRHAEAPADEAAAAGVAKAELDLRMSRYYDEARELARRLTEWSLGRETGRRFLICSGGGPGIMEAANRGASDVPNGRSVGLGISLPFEQGVNEFVTPELAFEFHYFFTRKYWFLYLCKALVIFPGGFGTLDELFETLTLIQTGKIKRKLPIVLYGKSYWEKVLGLAAMPEFGTISPGDVDLMHITDDLDDAFEYLTRRLLDSPAGTLLTKYDP
jgi:uncharacterized protein (TIGR00730 family)